jgi:ubiquinone/menaquinone biosynthesis C-methylase UbiE
MDYVSILRKRSGERALVTYDRRRKFILPYVRNKKVLDVGCVGGDWRFAESTIMLSPLHFQLAKCARETVGIDFNTKGLTLMKKRYAGLELFAADAYNLPFKDETFDLIVASDLLEHLGNAGIFLDEINRVLADNGTLVDTVPNVRDSTGLISLLFRIQPTPSKDSTHVRIFDDWTLSLLFLQHNFEISLKNWKRKLARD